MRWQLHIEGTCANLEDWIARPVRVIPKVAYMGHDKWWADGTTNESIGRDSQVAEESRLTVSRYIRVAGYIRGSTS